MLKRLGRSPTCCAHICQRRRSASRCDNACNLHAFLFQRDPEYVACSPRALRGSATVCYTFDSGHIYIMNNAFGAPEAVRMAFQQQLA
jgi:hypothetical protein